MNKLEIEIKIDIIKQKGWDAEAAHALEDDLYKEFIAYVASQGGELGELAQLVLTTQKLDFPRWCA